MTTQNSIQFIRKHRRQIAETERSAQHYCSVLIHCPTVPETTKPECGGSVDRARLPDRSDLLDIPTLSESFALKYTLTIVEGHY